MKAWQLKAFEAKKNMKGKRQRPDIYDNCN